MMERARQVEGSIPLSFLYTAGQAGQRFFDALKKQGALTASQGKDGKLYLPPKIYGESDFKPAQAWVPIAQEGTVHTFTMLDGPRVLALIKFKGVEGGLVHWLGALGNKAPAFGMKVRPVFKNPQERRGNILDLLYFAPAG